ncbi:hypothetical protein vBCjeMWX1_0100 [Campylobacter phage vB_CjeM_WX1]|nr:hypothetical protein vBCjeMWX1_0100 [Campylobacter phage vB_CjeM_WX1]
MTSSTAFYHKNKKDIKKDLKNGTFLNVTHKGGSYGNNLWNFLYSKDYIMEDPDRINISLSYKVVCELSKESYDLKEVKTVMDKHKAGFVYFN